MFKSGWPKQTQGANHQNANQFKLHRPTSHRLRSSVVSGKRDSGHDIHNRRQGRKRVSQRRFIELGKQLKDGPSCCRDRKHCVYGNQQRTDSTAFG
jgi:hypothetical protein